MLHLKKKINLPCLIKKKEEKKEKRKEYINHNYFKFIIRGD